MRAPSKAMLGAGYGWTGSPPYGLLGGDGDESGVMADIPGSMQDRLRGHQLLVRQYACQCLLIVGQPLRRKVRRSELAAKIPFPVTQHGLARGMVIQQCKQSLSQASVAHRLDVHRWCFRHDRPVPGAA